MQGGPAVSEHHLAGNVIAAGAATGQVLFSDVPLSFWGGVDPVTGVIIDQHHPLHGASIAGRILAIPGSRGSCTGSAVLLELLLGNVAPAGIVVSRTDTVLALGIFVAEELFGRSIPLISVPAEAFARIGAASHASISGAELSLSGHMPPAAAATLAPASSAPDRLVLSQRDRALLAGSEGEAAAVAMRIILRMARLAGAERLIDIAQAHIDGCIYTGPASLRFARRLCDLGARVLVPTTLNAISADERRWRAQGVEPGFAEAALALAHAYGAMGAAPTYTCAPYQLRSAPARGEHIAWAESNAVVFANSVIGARTAKYPDFLDICIAITGRAPLADCHLDAPRLATVQIDVAGIAGWDEALFPLLGHLAGEHAPEDIPVVTGLEQARSNVDDLRAFGAAFATTASAPMFHIAGVTPEAATLAEALGGKPPARIVTVGRDALARAWRDLNGSVSGEIDLVSLGNPHFSLQECAGLAALTRGRRRREATPMLIALSRAVLDQAREQGLVAELERFGAAFINDTCWCMIGEPVIPLNARVILTNSAKYAHYGPGLVGRSFRFGSLADCVEAACTGHAAPDMPSWLGDAPEPPGARQK